MTWLRLLFCRHRVLAQRRIKGDAPLFAEVT